MAQVASVGVSVVKTIQKETVVPAFTKTVTKYNCDHCEYSSDWQSTTERHELTEHIPIGRCSSPMDDGGTMLLFATPSDLERWWKAESGSNWATGRSAQTLEAGWWFFRREECDNGPDYLTMLPIDALIIDKRDELASLEHIKTRTN